MSSDPSKTKTANDAYYSILAARQDAYSRTLASGQYDPFVYPWDTFAAALLFLAILLVPRIPSKHRTLAKIGISAWIVYFGLQTILRARCLSLANGYGIGLMCTWGMIVTVTFLFCNDVGSDLQRLEWRHSSGQIKEHFNGSANASATGAEVLNDSVPAKRRVHGVDGPAMSAIGSSLQDPATNPYILVWQGYPTSVLHCIEWSADLMTTLRGVGWNWRIPTCPPLDVPVQDPEGKLKPRNVASTASPDPTSVPLATLDQLQFTALRDFAVYYLLLDFLKTIMMTDPYFMGIADLSSPSPWPFLNSSSKPTISLWLLTCFVRLTVSICGVLSALNFIFSLSPLFFITVLTTVLPLHYIHKITRSPILEPSLYPPFWQPLSTVADGGLAGLWGRWWHQLFRFGISEPSRALIQHFGLDRKGQFARLLQVSIAFGLSGLIHASASFTTFSASRPLSGPFTFFMLQAVGIVLQQLLTSAAKNYVNFAYRLPTVQKTANIIFVIGWLCLTGPFIADDFARCGIWLFEPVPVSPLRGLIWNDWLAWKNMSAWVGWYRGATWYKSGLAIY